MRNAYRWWSASSTSCARRSLPAHGSAVSVFLPSPSSATCSAWAEIPFVRRCALVHTGLLEVRQGAGTFVRSNRDPSELLESLDHAALHDQLEVRRALEVEAARLAASRRTDDDLKAISDALGARGSWTDAASLEAFVHRDVQFHLSIVRASHNAALVEMYRFFWAGLQNTIAGRKRRSISLNLPIRPTRPSMRPLCVAARSRPPSQPASC